jgi:hypothetical protein
MTHGVLGVIALDALIDAHSVGERIPAFRRRRKICDLSMQKSALAVYDRGSVSNGMAADLSRKGINFVSGPIQAIRQIGLPGCGGHDGSMAFNGGKFNAGVVKFRLENGVVEPLAANIPREVASIDE